jgi:hypothetical protein
MTFENKLIHRDKNGVLILEQKMFIKENKQFIIVFSTNGQRWEHSLKRFRSKYFITKEVAEKEIIRKRNFWRDKNPNIIFEIMKIKP